MAELYFARPFVSYAGPDGDGVRAEVLVTKGVAQVTEVDERGDTAQVTLSVPERDYPIRGWINTNTEAFQLAKKAFEMGNKPVAFRIETQRKSKNSKTGEPIKNDVPIYELMGADSEGHNKNMATTNANTRKLLVAVGKPGQELLFSQELTNPDEDPSGDSRSTSARNMPVGNVPPTVGGGAFPAGTSQAHVNGFREVQPWFGVNPGGEVNPGSYGVETEMDFYFWALELSAKRELGINPARARILATALANIAGNLQLEVYNGRLDTPDRNIGSYTRVRWILKKTIEDDTDLSIEHFKSQKALSNYLNTVSVRAMETWRWAIEAYAKSLGIAPYGVEPANEQSETQGELVSTDTDDEDF